MGHVVGEARVVGRDGDRDLGMRRSRWLFFGGGGLGLFLLKCASQRSCVRLASEAGKVLTRLTRIAVPQSPEQQRSS